jgi:hypothetical protein
MQSISPDFAELKSKMKASWMTGDFGQIANYNVKAGEEFVARTEIKSGCRLLDVACGTGNTALPAARAELSQVSTSRPICLNRRESGLRQNSWKFVFRKETLKSYPALIMNSTLSSPCLGPCSLLGQNESLPN